MLIPVLFSEPAATHGYIGGKATILKVPARLVVDLFERATRVWVRSTLATHAGVYQFDGLSLGTQYDLVGRDVAATRSDEILSARQARPY